MEGTSFELKDIRKSLGMTQKEAAAYLGVSLRSYLSYENEEGKKANLKYEFMKEKLSKAGIIDEEHGLLSLDKIKAVVADVLKNHDVSYCYLFGSYAKGKAKEDSDVDLLVGTSVSGLDFFGLIEELREALHKKVDLLTSRQLDGNETLLNEILKDGIKIYG